MGELIRFGVSIDSELLGHYDSLIARSGFPTRSEAIRDLIRDELIRQRLSTETEQIAIASLTLVYDHHARNLLQEMAEIQHDYHEMILSVMHLHVSHDDCMEIIALSGQVQMITSLSNRLLGLKGVKNGKLFLTLPSSKI